MSVRRLAAAAVLLLTLAAGTAAAEVPVKFDIHGYYWARGNWTVNLFDKEQPHAYGYAWALPYENPQHTYYMTMRGRFEPEITVADKFVIKSSIDVLDGVVWGDNENLSATPMFAANPSNTLPDGSQVDALELRRLWVEWTTDFGLLRIGRQPSHWGMGLLANSGDGFDDDFGDNTGGATYDRVIFATRPIDLVRGIAEKISGNDLGGPEQYPWIFAIGFDKLVESSQERYRSKFPCTDGDPGNDGDCDEYPEETTFLSADTEAGYRSNPIWLSDRGDDVNELILVSLVSAPGIQLNPRLAMDLKIGVYAVHRWQRETASDAWILDAYLHWKMAGIFLEAEGYRIVGTSKAIAPRGDVVGAFDCSFSDIVNDDWEHGDDSSCKAVNITGYAVRAGFEHDLFTVKAEVGMASGDSDLLDPVFTGRALHPDHNVGLILYKQVLPRLTAEAYANDLSYEPLWANGGVYNSVYLFPRVLFHPIDLIDVRFGVVAAWADRAGGNTALPLLDDEVHDAAITLGDTDGDGTTDSWRDKGLVIENRALGVELDAAVHLHFLDEHIDVAFEFGYLKANRRLQQALLTSYSPDELDANPAIAQRLSNIYTLQLRTAFIF